MRRRGKAARDIAGAPGARARCGEMSVGGLTLVCVTEAGVATRGLNGDASVLAAGRAGVLAAGDAGVLARERAGIAVAEDSRVPVAEDAGIPVWGDSVGT